jgi:hypothetical protein
MARRYISLIVPAALSDQARAVSLSLEGFVLGDGAPQGDAQGARCLAYAFFISDRVADVLTGAALPPDQSVADLLAQFSVRQGVGADYGVEGFQLGLAEAHRADLGLVALIED